MNALFQTIAIGYTSLNAVYYGVLMLWDATRKDEKKEETEVIKVTEGETFDEEPTEVEETEDGGYIIKKKGKNIQEKDDSPSDGKSSEEVIDEINNLLQPIPIESEAIFNSEELRDIILNGGITPDKNKIKFTTLCI